MIKTPFSIIWYPFYTWYTYKNDPPNLNVPLLVWRYERKRYLVLRLVENTTQQEEETPFSWLSQHNQLFNTHDQDSWMAFECVEKLVKYD